MQEGKPVNEFYKFLTEPVIRGSFFIFTIVIAGIGGIMASDWYIEQTTYYTSTKMDHTESFIKNIPEGNYQFEIILTDNVTAVPQQAYKDTFISGTISIFINNTLIINHSDTKFPEEVDDPEVGKIGYRPAFIKYLYDYKISKQSTLKIEILNATATFQAIYWTIIHRNQIELLVGGAFWAGAIMICIFLVGIRAVIVRFVRNK